MRIEDFPEDIKKYIIPRVSGDIVYQCLDCKKEYSIDQLLYSCPDCNGILMLPDRDFNRLKKIPGEKWRKIFDYRKLINEPALKGVFLFYEFIAPVVPLDKIIYLGEGHTPIIRANKNLRNYAGVNFYFKNDGQNPSASFKDRGLACAISYINHLVQSTNISDLITVCASSGDTSAAAALYSSYLHGNVRSAVLLPHKKVTPQQLSQPLSSGAKVFEIPGVFDDCMKIIEYLSDNYNVALLNSKNAWRLRGQESFSFEISQWFEYSMNNKTIVIPIGNAGNITAVMSGFLHFYDAGIIKSLPKIIGVQSEHANPVYKYYLEPDQNLRKFKAQKVRVSVAQAAMIGNPVSMPRVISVVKEYNEKSIKKAVQVISVTEQEIMDHQIKANRNGHIICTQGGMAFAGMVYGLKNDLINGADEIILDSTAHELKFSNFEDLYNNNSFKKEYNIQADSSLINQTHLLKRTGKDGEKYDSSIKNAANKIAIELGLEVK